MSSNEINVDCSVSNTLKEHAAVAIYFSAPNCGVCQILKPKIQELLSSEFPKIHYVEINSADHLQIAASLAVFTSPTLLIFFEGKESIRESRHISITDLRTKTGRPYKILFG